MLTKTRFAKSLQKKTPKNKLYKSVHRQLIRWAEQNELLTCYLQKNDDISDCERRRSCLGAVWNRSMSDEVMAKFFINLGLLRHWPYPSALKK